MTGGRRDIAGALGRHFHCILLTGARSSCLSAGSERLLFLRAAADGDFARRGDDAELPEPSQGSEWLPKRAPPFGGSFRLCGSASRAVAFDAQNLVLVDAKAEGRGDRLQPPVVGHPVDGCPVDAPSLRNLNGPVERAFDIGDVVPFHMRLPSSSTECALRTAAMKRLNETEAFANIS